ncbi:MAG: alkaline shock response membrane anchor protein AmaP [Thermoflexales bacterium]|nr:alkaline shock response membrane anchor protein AmaP [Thermoflexales bacterium]
MNLFNKIFTIITLVLALITGLLALIFPQQALQAVNGLAAGFHTSYFPATEGLARTAARLPLAIALAAVIAGILFFELRAPRSSTIEVAKATGGKVRVTVSSVESRILQSVNAMPDIVSSKVRVATRGSALSANIEAETPDTVDVIAKGEEIAANVKSVVEEQLGLKLQGKPNVVIKPKAIKVKAVSGGRGRFARRVERDYDPKQNGTNTL